jgi:mRNA interferase RelE/StbE
MRIILSPPVVEALEHAPPDVKKAFYKQSRYLAENLHHPSLRSKKYDAAHDLWQARVNRGWRFYFAIEYDAYRILNIIPHPK